VFDGRVNGLLDIALDANRARAGDDLILPQLAVQL
jgi:hypothetical protein